MRRGTARRCRVRAARPLAGVSSTLPGIGVRSLSVAIESGDAWRSIDVDDEPRVGLEDEHGVEPLGECAAQARDADVPGDVPGQLALRYAQVAQPPRESRGRRDRR